MKHQNHKLDEKFSKKFDSEKRGNIGKESSVNQKASGNFHQWTKWEGRKSFMN
jgi:uncharacterized protein YgbK (DUF1537 family)